MSTTRHGLLARMLANSQNCGEMESDDQNASGGADAKHADAQQRRRRWLLAALGGIGTATVAACDAGGALIGDHETLGQALNTTDALTFADLRSSNNPTGNNRARLARGRAVEGDGGGGLFQWIVFSGAAPADDDLTIIRPTAQTGGGRWVRVQTLQGISTLRQVPAPTGGKPYYDVLGHTTAGDGGGGRFVWNAGSTAGDNNGTIIAPAGGGSGRWRRAFTGDIDIRWFGAVPDLPAAAGSNTAAIQSAIDACATVAPGSNGGRVCVPQGKWHINGTVSLVGIAGVTLVGYGGVEAAQYSTLVWAGGFAPVLQFERTFMCGLDGIAIDGAGIASAGLVVTGASGACKGNTFTRFSVRFCSAPEACGIEFGGGDVASNEVADFLVLDCYDAVKHVGSQTVANHFRNGFIYNYGRQGFRILSGQASMAGMCFSSSVAVPGNEIRADVYVARDVGLVAARIRECYHEVWMGYGYFFEPFPDGAGAGAPQENVTLESIYMTFNTQIEGPWSTLWPMKAYRHNMPLFYERPGYLQVSNFVVDVTSRGSPGFPAVVLVFPTSGAHTGGVVISNLQRIGSVELRLNQAPGLGGVTIEGGNLEGPLTWPPANADYSFAPPNVIASGGLSVFHNSRIRLQDNFHGYPNAGAQRATSLRSDFGIVKWNTEWSVGSSDPVHVWQVAGATKASVSANGQAYFGGGVLLAPTPEPAGAPGSGALLYVSLDGRLKVWRAGAGAPDILAG